MKVISLTQPWATLIAIGEKRVETRSWHTIYRGPIAIHAAKGLSAVGGKRGLVELCSMEPFFTSLDKLDAHALPLGAIIAYAELYDIKRTRDVAGEISYEERMFGDYSSGRYAWLLRNVTPLAVPIACKGALGLWDFQPVQA